MTTQLIKMITQKRNLKIRLLKIKTVLLPLLHGASHVNEKRKIIDSEKFA